MDEGLEQEGPHAIHRVQFEDLTAVAATLRVRFENPLYFRFRHFSMYLEKPP